MPSVYYAVCPGTGGTSDKATRPDVSPSYVNGAFYEPDAPASSVAVNLNSITAGNLLVVHVQWSDVDRTVSSVSDGTSSFTSAGTRQVQGGQYSQMFYLLSANSGNKTITATFSNSVQYPSISVMEFSASSGKWALDTSNQNGGSGTSLTSGTITTTSARTVVVMSCCLYGGGSWSSQQIGGTAATTPSIGATNNIQSYRILSSVMTDGQATATASDSANWTGHIVAFKLAPTITISSGVATLSVAQTGNIGQGFRITYDTSKVCFISKVNSSTSFDVITATGGTPSDEASAVTVNSIAADYASLSAAEAGATDANHLNTSDLVTATTILNLVCYAGASADTTACTIDGYTTSADYYINIYVANGGTQSLSNNRHSGVWDTSKYRISHSSGSGNTLGVSDPYTRIIGIQIEKASANYVTMYVTEGNTLVDSVIMHSNQSTVGMLTFHGVSAQGTLRNSVLYSTGSSTYYGVRNNASGQTSYIYNCTIFGINGSGGCGIKEDYGTFVVKNCVLFNNDDDIYSMASGVTYTASDDNDIAGTGNIDLGDSAASWNAQFVDYDATNPDVSLIADSDLIGAGISHSSDSNVPEVDIAGTTRSSWDIGAFEYAVAGPKWNTITPAKWNGVDWGNLKWNGM